ncbi:hypothetical protein ACFOQM_16845, partial [Paenibacillus sp. GCM10012307]|uniref:hypothetical protein n=1 Tax=Paenibacillus TaxID=44249 RepID=UPI001E2F0604
EYVDLSVGGNVKQASEAVDWALADARVFRKVRERVAQAQEAMARNYNADKRPLSFQAGDLVRVTNRVGGRGALSHFAPRFLGPCEVTKVINRNAYRLRLPGGRESTFHVSLLEPWRTPPDETPSNQPTAESASPEGEAS